MPLVTDADVIAYLQIDGRCLTAAIQKQLTDLRIAAENAVKEYVGYEIEQATYEDLYPDKAISTRWEGDSTAVGFDMMGGAVVPRETFPTGRRELVLNQLPVRSITSIYDNPAAYNTAGGAWTVGLLPTNNYYLDLDRVGGMSWSGIVRRHVGAWSSVPNTIKITYVAGLTAAELASRYTEYGMAVKVAVAKLVGDAVARANTARTGRGPVGSVGIRDFSAAFAPGNIGLVGQFLGAGVTSSVLPTESMQWVQKRVHPKSMF